MKSGSNICSDRCKAISSITLVTVCLINMGFAAVIFFLTYVNLANFQVHGGTRLPNLNINFNSFSFYIMFCICNTILLLVIGLLAAQCKKPLYAFGFGIIAMCSFILLMYTSSIAF